MTPPEVGTPQDWLRHARADLQLARLARGQPGVLSEQVCFHAQQAAEKALKAILIARNMEFPFVHDLDELVELCREAGLTVPAGLEELDTLTPYAVAARYPGAESSPSETDASSAVELAARAIARPEHACARR